MKKSRFDVLEKFFWVTGWVILGVTTLSSVLAIYQYFEVLEPEYPNLVFEIVPHCSRVMLGLGEAFFAFLLSTIIAMIKKRELIRTKQAEMFLHLACFGFIGHALLSMVNWVLGTLQVTFSASDPLWTLLLAGASLVGTGLGQLIIIAQMVAIYVLYDHFTESLSFEAEVI